MSPEEVMQSLLETEGDLEMLSNDLNNHQMELVYHHSAVLQHQMLILDKMIKLQEGKAQITNPIVACSTTKHSGSVAFASRTLTTNLQRTLFTINEDDEGINQDLQMNFGSLKKKKRKQNKTIFTMAQHILNQPERGS